MADHALAEKAKATGTAFQSRADASQAFRQQYASTYTSRYDSEPSVRPYHIPQTTIINNTSYNVVYDRGYHGYGYFRGSSWFYYDPFVDDLVLPLLMTRHYYYYPGIYYSHPYFSSPSYYDPYINTGYTPAYAPSYPGYSYAAPVWHWGGVLIEICLTILFLGVLLIVIVNLVARR